MLYRESLSPAQVRLYLDRLDMTELPSCDLPYLNRVLFAQLTHIPFDSLDVWGTGICPSLKLEDLYEKIVVRGRGGYCFELNTFFRSLLNALGFDAYQVIACILNPDGTPQPPAHNVILCKLDGKQYFLDVGYGGPVPFQAQELTEGLQNGFLLRKVEEYWYVYRATEHDQRPLACFRDIPASINDLIPLNFYISQRPDSHFRHLIHLSKRNADGSIYALDGNTFKIHTPGGTCVREVSSMDEVKGILSTYFKMDPKAVPLRETL